MIGLNTTIVNKKNFSGRGIQQFTTRLYFMHLYYVLIDPIIFEFKFNIIKLI